MLQFNVIYSPIHFPVFLLPGENLEQCSFGQTRPKCRFLIIMQSASFSKKTKTACQHKHLIPTVKFGGEGLMVWACFAATGPGHLAAIELSRNSSEFKNILESKLSPPKALPNRVTQQDKNPKHANKSTAEWLQIFKKIKKTLRMLKQDCWALFTPGQFLAYFSSQQFAQ